MLKSTCSKINRQALCIRINNRENIRYDFKPIFFSVISLMSPNIEPSKKYARQIRDSSKINGLGII